MPLPSSSSRLPSRGSATRVRIRGQAARTASARPSAFCARAHRSPLRPACSPASNLGLGALLVVLPIYATTILDGGATVYAALTSALLGGDLVGSFTVGSIGWRWPLGRSIAAAQTSVGVAFLPMLLQPGTAATIALLFISGLLTSPLTIWAQTLRMRLIPPELRGRVFSLLRTIMQAAEPIGGALGGAVIAGGGLLLALAGIATAIGAPGLVGLRHPALAPARDAGPRAASGPR